MKLNKKYLLFLILATGLINQSNAWYDCRELLHDCSSYVPSIPSLFYLIPDQEQISKLFNNTLISATLGFGLGLVVLSYWHKVKRQKQAREKAQRKKEKLEKELQTYDPEVQKLIKAGEIEKAAKLHTLTLLRETNNGSFVRGLQMEKQQISKKYSNDLQKLDMGIVHIENRINHESKCVILNEEISAEKQKHSNPNAIMALESIRLSLLRNFFPRFTSSSSNN